MRNSQFEHDYEEVIRECVMEVGFKYMHDWLTRMEDSDNEAAWERATSDYGAPTQAERQEQQHRNQRLK